MIIAGIDYSMTNPCLCIYNGDIFSFSNCRFFYQTANQKYIGNYQNIIGISIPEYSHPIERFQNLAKCFIEIIQKNKCTYVAIEDYSMGSSAGRIFHIAENTAILKYHLYELKIPYVTIPPKSIKKFAIKGNADKELMYETFLKEEKVKLKEKLNYTASKVGSPISDIVDSYYITKYLFKGNVNVV